MKTSLANLYDIITLSETHLHQGIGDDLFEIEGFHDIIRNDRNVHGGGVAIYVKITLYLSVILNLSLHRLKQSGSLSKLYKERL